MWQDDENRRIRIEVVQWLSFVVGIVALIIGIIACIT